jgi:GGDEF domain-containing protein
VTNQSYRVGYLCYESDSSDSEQDILYCDPLTSLVAYPSFEQHLIKMLPSLVGNNIHIAIGDVDGLRDFVTERRAADPYTFGHLAGNACMRTVGALTSAWSETSLGDLAFRLCGTFGGDEVIIAATGLSHDAFAEKVNELCRTIKGSSPRPCSFALATLEPCTVTPEQAAHAYRVLVSMVDARLFHVKERAQLAGGHLDGTVSDLGTVSLVDQELDRTGIDCPATMVGGS